MKVMMRRSARALSRNQNYIQMGANIHVILCTIHRNPLSKTLCTLEIRWLFKIIHLYLLAVRGKTFTDVRWLRQNTMLLTYYVAVRWFHKNIYFQCVKFMTEWWTRRCSIWAHSRSLYRYTFYRGPCSALLAVENVWKITWQYSSVVIWYSVMMMMAVITLGLVIWRIICWREGTHCWVSGILAIYFLF